MGREIRHCVAAIGDCSVKFSETGLKGSYVIEIDRIEDERGFFARTFCKDEFAKHGIDFSCVQSSTSYNRKKGTLRGLHYQCAPFEESKIVSCIRGSVFDVIVDIRSDSPTYKKWFAKELSAENHLMLFVPKGFAHGFQTLSKDAEILYLMSEYFQPKYSQGMRWNDPQLGIQWPKVKQRIISRKDYQLPFLEN
jgi:dTDP-4-dehydrorhamnose 3,5-epimerase